MSSEGQYVAVGELALQGITRPVKRTLSIAIVAAKDAGLKGLVVPRESDRETAVVDG